MIPRSLLTLFLVLLVVAGASSSPARAAVATTFDTNLAGWRVTGDNAMTWEATTGHPGGCLSVNDLAVGNMNYVVAPPAWLGDWGAMTAGDSISLDIWFQNTSGGALLPAEWLFRLSGPGGVAVTQAGALPPQSAWTRLAASLDPAAWTLQSGTWQELLAQVDAVMIMGEYVNGDEVVRLDNIRLTGPVVRATLPCVAETFTAAGLADWSYANTGGATNPGAGGNSGGYCRISDGTGISYVYAPSRFLGDWRPAAGAGSLALDVRLFSGTGAWLDLSSFMRLSGPGGVAVAALDPALLPPIGRLWRTLTIPLASSSWTVVSGTWDGLLADVTEWRLQAEFLGGTEVVGLDNVQRSDGSCAHPDRPITTFVPEVALTGTTGFEGLSSVALNPADGHVYGVVDAASSAGGGLWGVTGPSAGVRVQAYAEPIHLIFDAGGNAFLTEDVSGLLHRRDAAGVSAVWVSGFHAGDDDPTGLCFAPAGFFGANVAPGDLIVTDRGYSGPDEVWTCSPTFAEGERQLAADPGEVDWFDVAASADGRVYLADALASGALWRLTADGVATTMPLAEPVTGINGLACDDVAGHLYFVEWATNTLRRTGLDGGAVETVAGGFSALTPCSVEVDVAGRRLWVTDAGAGRVYEFRLGSASAVDDEARRPAVGPDVALSAYPNPSTAGMTLAYALDRGAESRLEVHDLAGRLVRVLVSGSLPAGEGAIAWDGRDKEGRPVPAGLYLARLRAGGAERVLRLSVVR